MQKVIIVGCGSYMNSGRGCPGEWRCLKAAALVDGQFKEPVQVIAFVKCECPGRTVISNTKMAINLSGIKPDKIYLTTCMAKAKPPCPYNKPEDIANMLKENLGVEVVLGTHDYS